MLHWKMRESGRTKYPCHWLIAIWTRSSLIHLQNPGSNRSFHLNRRKPQTCTNIPSHRQAHIESRINRAARNRSTAKLTVVGANNIVLCCTLICKQNGIYASSAVCVRFYRNRRVSLASLEKRLRTLPSTLLSTLPLTKHTITPRVEWKKSLVFFLVSSSLALNCTEGS